MKLRIRYSKLGKVRFLSHRDVARVWERGIRRARLPIAYSEGFSPRPKLHFGLALSVGHESVDEYLDIDLRETVEVADVRDRLGACLPVGIELLDAAVLPVGITSLQEAVEVVRWCFTVPVDDASGLDDRVAALLAAPEWPIEVERKAKPQTIDLRAQLDGLWLQPGEPHVELHAEVRTRPRSVRPGELLAALGLAEVDVRVRRLHQFIESDGVRRSPLSVADPDRAPAVRGAV